MTVDATQIKISIVKRVDVRRARAAGSLVVLLVAAAVSAQSATAGGSDYCRHSTKIRTVFPTAKAIGFSQRGSTTFQAPRAPVWPGRCVGWWVEYRRLGQAGRVESYADVSVTVYRTHAQALAALTEPLAVPTLTLSDGARARIDRHHGWILSVIDNVLIGSTSSYLPTDGNGVPDFAGGPDLSVPVLMRIHRVLHANILRLQ